MDIWHLVSMLGGLALFLFGMTSMGDGLELVAGNRLQRFLEKLTTNKLSGVMVGVLITAIIQSSSATTVMVVGFVNSNLMNLSQAVNVIMGANIGTTVTSQLIALNITKYAPIFAFIGIVLTMSKSLKRRYLGKIVIGLGFLFMGLSIMSESMAPLQESEAFINWMKDISNPFFGLLIGAVFTAIIQSSSASVGILQALAMQGLVPFHTAFYIVLGQNIGTCITSVLASIGASSNAKRAAASHVLFNLIGSIFFILFSFILPLENWIISLSPDNPMRQIANLHVIFNLVTTIFLLPFSNYLANLATVLIRKKDGEEDRRRLLYVNPNGFGDNVVMFSNIRQEIMRMLSITNEAFRLAAESFEHYDDANVAKVRESADTIHFLDGELTKVSVDFLSHELGRQQSETLTDYIRILSNLDRTGDYSLHIAELMESGEARNLSYTEAAQTEAKTLIDLIQSMFTGIREQALHDDFVLRDIYSTQYQIDSLAESYRNKHLNRMREGICGAEAGLNYDKFLSHIQRISDHLVHVAEGFASDDD
ncbi:MAG: Na/Pi cotransporter family protein [Ndongobacter sp.]|nr:Na/Pi cotransporter family protein [Ndongobacter sp.]